MGGGGGGPQPVETKATFCNCVADCRRFYNQSAFDANSDDPAKEELPGGPLCLALGQHPYLNVPTYPQAVSFPQNASNQFLSPIAAHTPPPPAVSIS